MSAPLLTLSLLVVFACGGLSPPETPEADDARRQRLYEEVRDIGTDYSRSAGIRPMAGAEVKTACTIAERNGWNASKAGRGDTNDPREIFVLSGLDGVLKEQTVMEAEEDRPEYTWEHFCQDLRRYGWPTFP